MGSDYGYLGVGDRPLSSAFMQSLHNNCRQRGCQLPQAIELLKVAEQVAKNEQERTPGKESELVDNRFLGCESRIDPDHGFMAKRGYVEMEIRVYDPANPNIDQTEKRVFCLPHASRAGLYHSPAEATAIESGDTVTITHEQYANYQSLLEKEISDEP